MSNDNKTYTFYLPIFVMLPRKTKADKKVHLNMNQFVNYSRFTINDAKQLFQPIFGEPFKASKIRISYFLQKKHKREFDTMNFVSIVDKFFLDWLVKEGYIPNDKFYNVSYGKIDGTYQCGTDRVIATVEIINNKVELCL